MYELSTDPIDVQALLAAAASPACGAVVAFVGTVRESSPDDERPVISMYYEAYQQMAVPEIRAIAEETQERYDVRTVLIVHRVGELAIGDASVAVVVAAPHRAAAFDACEYAMDEVKRRVQIWKAERYAGGEHRWQENADALP